MADTIYYAFMIPVWFLIGYLSIAFIAVGITFAYARFWKRWDISDMSPMDIWKRAASEDKEA